MIVKELFGHERHAEFAWRGAAGAGREGKKIWIKTRDGRRYGPFASERNADSFLGGRKDLGPGAVKVYE